MKVYYGLSELNIKKPVVTLGSFDGVHLGHQQVIKSLKKYAYEIEGESVIVTFNPHPREVLYPLEKSPGILTTLDEKIELLTSYHIDNLIVLEFTPELAAYNYEEFVKLILVDKLHISSLVIGYDHRFGKNREGDFNALNLLGQKYNFSIVQQEVYTTNEINVSSTKIRTGLETGDIEYVNQLLGYKYSFSGKVTHGDKIGREIGFPTANIQLNDEKKMLPIAGVYAVEVKLDNRLYKGMLNIGTRPSISNSGITKIEVHILDFAEDIYNKNIEIFLIKRIRGEQKFDTKEELANQLIKDKNLISHLLNN